jgi:hypothetical protein
MFSWVSRATQDAANKEEFERLYTQIHNYETRLAAAEEYQRRVEALFKKNYEILKIIDQIYSAIPVAERVFEAFKDTNRAANEYRQAMSEHQLIMAQQAKQQQE